MNKQSLLWTALPNGFSADGRALRLSVLVSPRLEPDSEPKLETFSDFADWPATLARSRFTLHFGAQPPVSVGGQDFAGPTHIGDQLGVPDSTTWNALFPRDTVVHGYQFRDLTQHSVLSYPAADTGRLVQNLYASLAASSLDQLPTVAAILAAQGWSDLVGAVAENDRRFVKVETKGEPSRRTAIRDVRTQFAVFKHGGFGARNLHNDLARFQLFHTPSSTPRLDGYKVDPKDPKWRAEWLGYKQTDLPTADEFQNKIDFHQIVAAMSQYPTLLRRLGLVVDLVIASDAFAPSSGAPLWVEVELPQGHDKVARLPDVSPRTQARLDSTRFAALSRPTSQPGDFRIVDGVLDMDPKTFSLMQLDVDGAGLKVANYARSLSILQGNPDYQMDPVTKHARESGAPALRNGGLALVHNRRADMLENTIARQTKFNESAEKIQSGIPNPPPPPDQYAEDLLRGYRVDIWDDISKQWHSLCRRKASYNIGSGAILLDVPEEEGTVRLAATTSADPASNQDIIWLHETLVAWTGWSLCAPPPGRTIGHQVVDENQVVVHTDPVTDSEPEVPPGLNLTSSLNVFPDSLPRLRYGRSYRLRARVVDLAGNSLEWSHAPDQKQKAETYYRYEPISPPAIALVKPTLATIDAPLEGESMECVAIRSLNDTPTLNTVSTSQRARRFAVPSRTNQREAEQHGVLDHGGIVDAAFFSMLATKDNSLFEQKLKSTGPLAGGPTVETSYATLSDGDALPYLPDPLALEVAARIFDHPTFPSTSVLTIPFYDGTRWPDALPFKIEIYEDPADKPRYDAATRTLLVPLPKAARCTLRLSIKPSDDALKILGVWNWLTAAQKAQTIVIGGHQTTLEKMTRNGQHWMLTPWRNLTLVHAVQRPLITPEIVDIAIQQRGDGVTFALPNFIAACSIASTDRLDLRAIWNEPFDDESANPPGSRARVDHAFSIKVTDTKAYAGDAEYALTEVPDVIRAGGVFHDRVAKKFHEFHNTRYRRIQYWLEATTKFREFMSASLLIVGGEPSEENIRIVGPKVRTWIPSSAPPPAPEVLYAVPTFGWVRSGDEQTKSSWRRGGGLRVYLKRPWNVSGYGEMLAVVLPSATFAGDPNQDPVGQPLKKFVTQWGNDPIWQSSSVSGVAPKSSDFPLARNRPDPDGKWLPSGAPPEEADQPPGAFMTTGLTHPELRIPTGQSRVDVAPHDVFFDEERQLWYCDIEVSFGQAYFPFIRLALSRYQPVAVGDAHLSSIVLSDFMQLMPDRWLSVTQARDSRTREVAIFGHTFTGSSSHKEAAAAPSESLRLLDGTIIDLRPADVASTSVVEVWVERFYPEWGEDFGWQREADAIVLENAPHLNAIPLAREASVLPHARALDLLQHREFEALMDERLIGQILITPTLWQGTVTLPQTRGTERFRLVIAEYEEYLVDDAMPYDRIPTKKDRRLVFVEHVEL